MHISVQLPGELAVGEEKDRIHKHGPDVGTFYVSLYVSTDLTKDGDGNYDMTEAYFNALGALLSQDSRVREGQAYRLSIIA